MFTYCPLEILGQSEHFRWKFTHKSDRLEFVDGNGPKTSKQTDGAVWSTSLLFARKRHEFLNDLGGGGLFSPVSHLFPEAF